MYKITDELPFMKEVYDVTDLFHIIENKKLKVQKQINNKEVLRYRTSVIELTHFLRSMQNELNLAQFAYDEAVDQSRSMAEEEYILIFKPDPRNLPIGFRIGYNEVQMALNIVYRQLNELSPLEKSVLGMVDISPSFFEQALPSKHPFEQNSHPTQ